MSLIRVHGLGEGKKIHKKRIDKGECKCRPMHIFNSFERIIIEILFFIVMIGALLEVLLLLISFKKELGSEYRNFIDVLTCIYWAEGFLVVLVFGPYYFNWFNYFNLKSFPLKPSKLKFSESKDEIFPEDSWRSFVISTRDNRFKQLINMDIYAVTGIIGWMIFATQNLDDNAQSQPSLIGRIVFCVKSLFMSNEAVKRKGSIVLAGLLVSSFFFLTHFCASLAYIEEVVKKCPSVRFSKEEGIWLLEVTDEILHRLILADLLGFFIFGALIVRIFSLRY